MAIFRAVVNDKDRWSPTKGTLAGQGVKGKWKKECQNIDRLQPTDFSRGRFGYCIRIIRVRSKMCLSCKLGIFSREKRYKIHSEDALSLEG